MKEREKPHKKGIAKHPTRKPPQNLSEAAQEMPRPTQNSIVIEWIFPESKFNLARFQHQKHKSEDKLSLEDLKEVETKLKNLPEYKLKSYSRNCFFNAAIIAIFSICIMITTPFTLNSGSVALIGVWGLGIAVVVFLWVYVIIIEQRKFDRRLKAREKAFRRVVDGLNDYIFLERGVRVVVGSFGLWLVLEFFDNFERNSSQISIGLPPAEPQRGSEHQEIAENSLEEGPPQSVRDVKIGVMFDSYGAGGIPDEIKPSDITPMERLVFRERQGSFSEQRNVESWEIRGGRAQASESGGVSDKISFVTFNNK